MTTTWKTGRGVPANFARYDAESANLAPTIAVTFILPATAPTEMDADAAADSDGPMNAFVADWQAKSETYLGFRRLQAEQVATTARRETLTAKAASLQSAVDEALYDGRSPDKLETQLENVRRDLRAAEFRATRLTELVPKAKQDAAAELRIVLEAERQRQAARLEAEVAKAADDLAGAAESLAGLWYVKSAALFRICHSHDVDRYIADAVART